MNADLYKSLIKDEIISLSLLLLKEIKLFQFQVFQFLSHNSYAHLFTSVIIYILNHLHYRLYLEQRKKRTKYKYRWEHTL